MSRRRNIASRRCCGHRDCCHASVSERRTYSSRCSGFFVESVKSVESVPQSPRSLFGGEPLGMPLGLIELRIRRTNRIQRSLERSSHSRSGCFVEFRHIRRMAVPILDPYAGANANGRSGRHEDFWMTDSTDVTDFTDTAEPHSTAATRRVYGGNTAQRHELEKRSNKEESCFLSLLSGLFLSLLSVSNVFQPSKPKASSPSNQP
jgi:hypothetical protein